MKSNERPMNSNTFLEDTLPSWIEKCPLMMDWCVFKGEIYFAVIDWEESEKRQKPVFDLAYCATSGLNGIFLRKGVWEKNKFQPWEGRSTWSHRQQKPKNP